MVGKPTATPAVVDVNSSYATGLVLAMVFNEGIGTPADVSSSPTTTSLVGSPTWQIGNKGKEMLFTAASSQSVDCGNPSKLQVSSDMSFCLEYKLSSRPPTNQEYVFFGKDTSNAPNTSRGFAVDVAEWGNRGARFFIAGGSYGEIDENVNCASGDTKQLMGTYSVTNNLFQFYVNGVSVGSSTATNNIPNDTANAYVAQRAGTSLQYLDGVIKYCYMWNRMLTTAEFGRLAYDPFALFIRNSMKINNLRPSAFAPGMAR
jgi:hypothetical protein